MVHVGNHFLRSVSALVLCLVPAVCVACTSAPPPASPQSSLSGTPVGKHRVTGDLPGLVDEILTTSATDSYRNCRAVLISIDGKQVVSRYRQSTPDTTLDIQGVGEGVMSTLIGIALDERRLHSMDQTVAELLPSYRAVMAPRVKAITLRHLLTMTAGLPTDDVYIPRMWDKDVDWIARTLADSPSSTPGEFSESTASTNLLAAILAQAVGRSVLDYAREKLFDPLGIPTRPAVELVASPKNVVAYQKAGFAWLLDPKGHPLGVGQKMTAADLAKLGQLWLDNGRWGDRQIVSASWMGESTRPRVQTDNPGVQYGYHLWVTEEGGHKAYATTGYGGQLLEVVPDLGLVVVVLSSTSPDPTEPADPGAAGAVDYAAIVAQDIVPIIS